MILRRLFSALRRIRAWARSFAMRLYLRLAYPGVACHASVRFGAGVRVRALSGGRIVLGAGTTVHDRALLIAEGGTMVIGKDCLIGWGSVIVANQAVTIGDGCLIAEYVTLRDSDHNHAGEARLEAQGLTTGAIVLGHDVWLGAKVTVTRGVEIASHAVVGANAVVTRSLPERATYGGVPARRIG